MRRGTTGERGVAIASCSFLPILIDLGRLLYKGRRTVGRGIVEQHRYCSPPPPPAADGRSSFTAALPSPSWLPIDEGSLEHGVPFFPPAGPLESRAETETGHGWPMYCRAG